MKGEALQEIPEPIRDGDVANHEGTGEPASLPRPRRRAHHKRVLAVAGTMFAILVGSGISASVSAPPSDSGTLGRAVDHATTSGLRVRTHDAARPATVPAVTRHPHTAAVGAVVRATLPLGNETTAVVGPATVRTLAIGASISVVAPTGGSGLTLQGTTTTNNARAPSTTTTAPRPVVTTDTTPYSLPKGPVTILHPYNVTFRTTNGRSHAEHAFVAHDL